jgi:glycosyltransferase involved in cell wall biosynthesis
MQKVYALMTDVTVLIATHNGESVLPRTLEGYARQSDIRFTWNMVLVDNGSTDRTFGIIKSFQDRLKIEMIFEPIAGKNHALNAGLRAADGEVVIISDDDAIPEPDFLIAWREVFIQQLSFDVFGGTIEPLFDIDPPEWMSRGRTKFEELFSARTLPDGPIEPGEIFGPNMAVRRSVFDQGLRFSGMIGPDQTDQNYPMGSETEFCVRAYARGHKAWFARRPRVWHIVRPYQLKFEYCSRRAYRHGRGRANMHWSSGPPARRFGYSAAAIAAGNAYQNLRQYLRWCRTLTPQPAGRLNSLWDYHWNRGFRDEYARQLKAYLGTTT